MELQQIESTDSRHRQRIPMVFLQHAKNWEQVGKIFENENNRVIDFLLDTLYRDD